MNDNIRRLLAQAYLEQADIRDTTKIAEKFAELIVKECADIVTRQPTNIHPIVIAEVMKRTFGVEE